MRGVLIVRAWSRCLLLSLMLTVGIATAVAAADPPPIIVGLDADLSAGSAQAGEAIRRGAQIAIAEINARGGLLGGRRLELQAKDHRGIPPRSTDNLIEFAATDNLVAVLGGLHSPAIIQNHAVIHEHRLIMLVPWAAASAVVDHAFIPNYVFRISVRDQFVGPYLSSELLRQGHHRIGLLLERTGWGRGNESAIREALGRKGLEPVAVQWINLGDTDLMPEILALEEAGADALIMVANAPEGAAAVQALAKRPADRRLPVVAHWGITGGRFPELAGAALSSVDLRVLQTFSFIGAKGARSDEVLRRYRDMFGVDRPEGIPAPNGTAQAYDLVHVLALAIGNAGTIERSEVRNALEQLKPYAGLIRNYRPPFTPERHEGLSSEDYQLARFGADGALRPVRNGPWR